MDGLKLPVNVKLPVSKIILREVLNEDSSSVIICKYGIGTHNERDTMPLIICTYKVKTIQFFDQKPVENLEIF